MFGFCVRLPTSLSDASHLFVGLAVLVLYPLVAVVLGVVLAGAENRQLRARIAELEGEIIRLSPSS